MGGWIIDRTSSIIIVVVVVIGSTSITDIGQSGFNVVCGLLILRMVRCGSSSSGGCGRRYEFIGDGRCNGGSPSRCVVGRIIWVRRFHYCRHFV